MRIITRVTTLAAIPAVAVALLAGAASASTTHQYRPQLAGYEADNGTTWTLTHSRHGISSTGPQKGYADAGVVVALGPAAKFAGISARGSANLAENLWIIDGPQAVVPGTHPLSGGADFDYGFRQADGSFYMTDGKYAGQKLTVAQIRADFYGYRVEAWVGIESSGTPDAGYVTSVNGLRVPALLGIVTHASGKVTAFVLPFRR